MRPAAASADESLRLRPLVNAVSEQATFKLAPNGTIITGNPGVENSEAIRLTRLSAVTFRASTRPQTAWPAIPVVNQQTRRGMAFGSMTAVGCRLRRDGSRFWAHVIGTALYDGPAMRGFAKVKRPRFSAALMRC
jgi:hypothetical protein